LAGMLLTLPAASSTLRHAIVTFNAWGVILQAGQLDQCGFEIQGNTSIGFGLAQTGTSGYNDVRSETLVAEVPLTSSAMQISVFDQALTGSCEVSGPYSLAAQLIP
jgi:hypothetical protein